MTLGKMPKLLGALVLANCAMSAQALNGDSGQLIRDGGTHVVEHLASGSDNGASLRKASGEEFLFVDNAAGQTTFSRSSLVAYGNVAAEEPVFSSQGPAYNLSRLAYPAPGYADSGNFPDAWVQVAFEDKIVPSDQDFSDVVFRARTVGGSVPEPASLVLVGVGLAGLGLARRRRNSGR